jgi:hypothetical protein
MKFIPVSFRNKKAARGWAAYSSLAGVVISLSPLPSQP